MTRQYFVRFRFDDETLLVEAESEDEAAGIAKARLNDNYHPTGLIAETDVELAK